MKKLLIEVLDHMVFYGWLEAETATWLQLKENEEELKDVLLYAYEKLEYDKLNLLVEENFNYFHEC